MKRSHCRLIFILFLFCSRCEAQSAGPPMLTDDPGTPGLGNWEINAAFTSTISDVNEFEAPLLDINYGYRERTQLKVEMPMELTETNKNSFGDKTGSPLIGIKQRFLDEDKNFISVSTYPQWLIPIQSGDSTVFKIPLELEKTVGRFLFGKEIGMFVSPQHSPTLFGGNLVGYKISGRAEAMAEWYIMKEGNNYSSQRFLNLGGRYAFSKKFILLIAAGTQEHTPRNESRETFFSYTGLQMLFGRVGKK